MIIVSIDVGISNLGLTVAISDEYYNIKKIKSDLVNLNVVECNEKTCDLFHSNHIVDKLMHFLQNYNDIFSKSDFVLIERQPFQGITSIEAMLYNNFRNKAILIHPRTIHKFFNFGSANYDGRKKKSVKKAIELCKKIVDSDSVLKKLKIYERSHDMADSILFLFYFVDKKRNELKMTLTKSKYFKKKKLQTLDKFKYKADSNE